MNRQRWSIALGAMLGLGLGCHGNDTCTQDGTPCGGDPTGHWTMLPAGSCRDPFYKTPERLTYLGQPQTPALVPLPEATSSDWCSYLVYGADGITNFQFVYDTPAIGGVGLTFGADATYSARITAQVLGEVDIPEVCLTRFGVRPTCGPATPASAPARSLTDDLTTFSATAGSYQLIACSDGASGGCHCHYQVDFDPTVGGTFTIDGSGMSLFDSNKRLPSAVDFCVAGDTLSLWGHNHASIWDQVPGTRTLHLARAPAAP